jgi:hypothetical protein
MDAYEVRARTPDRGEQVLAARESGESIKFAIDRGLLIPGRYEFEVFAVDGTARRLLAFVPADLK